MQERFRSSENQSLIYLYYIFVCISHMFWIDTLWGQHSACLGMPQYSLEELDEWEI